ncbi:MAG: TetR/AcrR family transcriptional regulator [Janthinobacterium lividum]
MHCGSGPRAERAEERRRHLLDTARTLFAEHGFHQTGIARIAEASGIKVGQIYRDFDSKEAIIAAIVEADIIGWLEEDVLAAAVLAHDLPAIRRWIARFGDCDETLDECRMMTQVVAESARNERIAAIHRAVDERCRASLTAALSALAPGCCRAEDSALLVEFILIVGFGAAMRRAIHPEMPTHAFGRLLRSMVDWKLDLLTS